MKLHYMGKYDQSPDSLPHGEHIEGNVPFREAKDSKTLSIIANGIAFALTIILLATGILRTVMSGITLNNAVWTQLFIGAVISVVILFPHELLHALCFKGDVYLYTNWSQGMLFVIGPETMSKGRFVFMSLLPNIVFGFIPYIIGMIFPNLVLLTFMGALCTGSGAGDYYNVFNALTQMPRGARTYLYKFNSYWYMPKDHK